MTMTFEQFQATRRWSDDLAAAVSSDVWDDQGTPRGWLYLDALYIEEVREWWPQASLRAGRWHLLIERSEFLSDDLAILEHRLYVWAIASGYCGDPVTATDLQFDDYGSVWVMEPRTIAAHDWIAAHIPVDAERWGPGGVVVEPRCVADMAQGATGAGLRCAGPWGPVFTGAGEVR